MDQTVKNLPAILETWVRSLSWEDPLEEGIATLVFLPGESPWTGEPWGNKESDMTERLSTAQHIDKWIECFKTK